MHEAQNWRELLSNLVSDTRERAHLADELHVTPITLVRWANGESDPRPQNLRHLVTILPQYRDQLFDLMEDDQAFKDIYTTAQDDEAKEIPAEFYVRVFDDRSRDGESRSWPNSKLILEHALEQLDPDKLGLSIWLATCMPLSGPYNKVRSLREMMGVGTPPWPSNMEQQAMLLGAESLAGNVVTLCRPSVVQDVKKEHQPTPITITSYERSSAVYPILYAGNIAGALIVSSNQLNNFTSQARVSLIQKYADLLALTLSSEHFFPPDKIALNVLPDQELQKPYFSRFRQMLSDAIRDANRNRYAAQTSDPTLQVWQQLEERLLQVAAYNK